MEELRKEVLNDLKLSQKSTNVCNSIDTNDLPRSFQSRLNSSPKNDQRNDVTSINSDRTPGRSN